MPPANRANLEELECRQIWCSPGVCDVKVNLPSEPYWRDRITCRSHTEEQTQWLNPADSDTFRYVCWRQSLGSPCHRGLWLPQTCPDPEWPAGIPLSVCCTAESDSFLQTEIWLFLKHEKDSSHDSRVHVLFEWLINLSGTINGPTILFSHNSLLD